MVQIFDKAELKQKEIFVVVPDEKKIEEKIEEKVEKKPKKKLFKKYSKSPESKIDVNKVRRNIDSKMYTNRYMIR
jgi:hypothetical protein